MHVTLRGPLDTYLESLSLTLSSYQSSNLCPKFTQKPLPRERERGTSKTSFLRLLRLLPKSLGFYIMPNLWSTSRSLPQPPSDQNGIVACIFHDLHPPLSDRYYLRGPDDVLHEGGIHIWARGADSDEALGIHPARPALDQNLRFIFRIAACRHWIPSVHGFFCEGQRFSGVFRQRVYNSSCFHGSVEDLLWKEGGGPSVGLAQADCWRHSIGPVVGFLSCLLLEREVWLASAPHPVFADRYNSQLQITL